MKKFFQTVGLLVLICFSFFYTEKVSNVAKEIDELMVIIKQKSNEYRLNPIDAKITNKTITPGTYGKEIDIERSYQNIKRVGKYNDNLLIYKQIKPNISIEKNYDNYVIGGNQSRKEVSIIILVNEKTNLDYIKLLANSKDIKLNLFVDSSLLQKDSTLINDLIKEGHNIGNLSENNDYSNSTFIWMDTILKKIVKQENNYCYLEKENDNFLKICSLNKNHTIIPSIIAKKNITSEIKKNIKNGSIISLDGNELVIDELSSAINYIQSKGYNIVALSKLLNEKMG